MNNSLVQKLSARMSGTCLYGLAPPKQATPLEQLEGIVAQQLTRLKSLPIILTFAPCGSLKTLSFMKWLGVAVPRWLENELRIAKDPLATSLNLCERIFAEVWDYAQDKGIPLGINVESVSIRKAEIEASVELLQLLRQRIDKSERAPESSGHQA